MQLEKKDQVLLALYVEYQKDIPKMSNVTENVVGLDRDAFKVSIAKLQSEGYIQQAVVQYGGDGNIPLYANIDNVMLTVKGIEHIENLVGIDKNSSKDKIIKGLLEFTKEIGLECINNFIFSGFNSILL